VLEVFNDIFFGFNLNMKTEKRTAEEIVLGNCSALINNDEVVIGWKVAKDLPSWVCDVVAWEGFVIDISDFGARFDGFSEYSSSDDVSINSEKSDMKQDYVVNVDDKEEEEDDSGFCDEDEEESDKENKGQNVKVDQVQEDEEEEEVENDNGKETDEYNTKTSSGTENTDEDSDVSVASNDHHKIKKQHNESNVEDDPFMNLFGGDLRLKVAKNLDK
jgi:hypothetical protein